MDHLHSQHNASYCVNTIEPPIRPISRRGTNWLEIPPKDLKIFPDKVLGSGQYGIVLLGEFTDNNYQEKKCAIKTLKGSLLSLRHAYCLQMQEHFSFEAFPSLGADYMVHFQPGMNHLG